MKKNVSNNTSAIMSKYGFKCTSTQITDYTETIRTQYELWKDFAILLVHIIIYIVFI